jgi:hypothetical protein
VGGGHGRHDPLLGAAGADEPEEPDEPEEFEEPEDDDPDEPEDEDTGAAGPALVTEPPAAGPTGVPTAGTYRSVTRVTYGRRSSCRPAGRFPACVVVEALSSPVGTVSWAVWDAATPASQPVAVSAPAAPSPVTAATASRPRSRSLLV